MNRHDPHRSGAGRGALIVGAGSSGLLHALAFRSAGLRIATIFDPDPERAELLASIVGGVPTSAFERAVAESGPVAAICSPPPFHVGQAEALGRPDRLLFVEKPVALDACELERLGRTTNVVPVFQWRAGRAACWLRRAIREGLFGPAPAISCDLRLWRDDAYFEGGRRGRAAWGCGAMLSIGIHAIDLALWIVGRRVRDARGREWNARRGVDVTTRGELEVSFEGGARAAIHLTVDAEGANDVHLEVQGGAASATLTGTEADPTGGRLTLRGEARSASWESAGSEGSPLLVPFVHEALAAFDAGGALLSLDEVVDAHALAYAIAERPGTFTEAACRRFRCW